ncbi:MAG: TlpA disulfide reductase family protein [Pirellulaceae bacterium]|nr:TlpA disulfide reductase family protein [Pirellulaceae bacterium]
MPNRAMYILGYPSLLRLCSFVSRSAFRRRTLLQLLRIANNLQSTRGRPGIVALVLCALSLLFAASLQAENTAPVGHLRLVSGDFAVGSLVGSEKPNQIGWQCKEFDRPLFVDINQMRRLETGVLQQPFATDDIFQFEINGVDSLIGALIDADPVHLKIRNEILGDVQVPVAKLSQMRRIESPHDVLFNSIATAFSFRDAAEKQGWEVIGQALVADRPSKRFIGDIHLAAQSRIDLRLSWESPPQFVIAFGVNESEASIDSAPHLEIWDRTLVLVQQIKGLADATFLRELTDSETDIALTVYQDQASGEIAVFSISGTLLGKIRLFNPTAHLCSNIAFYNHGPSFSLNSITVSQWNGQLPYPYGSQSENASAPSRREVTGVLKSFDRSKRAITIQPQDSAIVTVSIDELSTFVPQVDTELNATQTGDAGIPRVHITLSDGSQITGELEASTPDQLTIQTKYSSDLYSCATNKVLSIRKLSDAVTALPSASTRMKLKMEGIELTGQLSKMQQSAPNAMLVFQPSAIDEPVGIRDSAFGTISSSRANTTPLTTPANLQIRGNVRIILPGRPNLPEEADSPVVSAFRTPRGMQLRTGELLDSTIDSIDEAGVHFHSGITSNTFLPHDAMQSVQIKVPPRGIPIDVKKMARLLTVPRMRRDNPPTHLLVTIGGDYIRGRLVRMTAETLEFEEGITPLSIPRNTVAVIIWLFDRSWEEEDEEKTSEADETFQVHIKTRSAGRFTFVPDKTDQEKLYGTSALLGKVQCELNNIESLEFGNNIGRRSPASEENAWRLHLAKLPMVFEEDANGLSRIDHLGTSSDLVGKIAPNFQLKSIMGHAWRMGDQKGKVTVLDFWASWCGPCMQAMPEVERVVTDLQRDDVQWIGINLQETAERAQSSIDRLRIQSLVLLDEDGGVGTEYDAQAIPLTVLVDREGIVRHVFVGGGSEMLDAIAKAIQNLAAP